MGRPEIHDQQIAARVERRSADGSRKTVLPKSFGRSVTVTNGKRKLRREPQTAPDAATHQRDGVIDRTARSRNNSLRNTGMSSKNPIYHRLVELFRTSVGNDGTAVKYSVLDPRVTHVDRQVHR